MSAMFRVWSTNSTLIGAAAQFRAQMEELVGRTLVPAKFEKDGALDNLRATLAERHAQSIRDLSVEHAADIVRLKGIESDERVALAAQREEQFHHALTEDEERWKAQVVLVQEAGKEALAAAEERFKIEFKSLVDKHEVDLAVTINEGLARVRSKRSANGGAGNANGESRLRNARG